MFRRIAVIAGTDGIIKGVGFLLLPIYLALMPKEQFGEFGYIASAVSFLVPVVILGLYVPQIKEFSATSDIQRRKVIFSTTLFAVTAFLVLVIAAISLSGIGAHLITGFFGVQKNQEEKWPVFALLLFSSTINLVLYAHVMSWQRSSVLAWFNAFRFMAISLFSLLCLYYGLGYADASLDRLIGTTAGETLFMIITLYWAGRDYWTWKFDKEYLRKAAKTGLAITPSAVAGLIAAMSDRYFLGLYHGMGVLAEYNLAMQFLLPVQMIMTAVQTAWSPIVFSFKRDTEAHSQSMLLTGKMIVATTCISLGICLLVILAKVLHMVPIKYANVEWLVPLFAISSIASTLVHLPNNLLIRSENTVRVSIISWVGALLTAAAGFVIIKPFGYWGAGIAAAVIQLFILWISWRAVKSNGICHPAAA